MVSAQVGFCRVQSLLGISSPTTMKHPAICNALLALATTVMASGFVAVVGSVDGAPDRAFGFHRSQECFKAFVPATADLDALEEVDAVWRRASTLQAAPRDVGRVFHAPFGVPVPDTVFGPTGSALRVGLHLVRFDDLLDAAAATDEPVLTASVLKKRVPASFGSSQVFRLLRASHQLVSGVCECGTQTVSTVCHTKLNKQVSTISTFPRFNLRLTARSRPQASCVT